MTARHYVTVTCVSRVVFASSGVFVIGITALDVDEGLNGQVSYHLDTSDYFSINATTGVITTRQRLTSSVTSQFNLIATASDMVRIRVHARRPSKLRCI